MVFPVRGSEMSIGEQEFMSGETQLDMDMGELISESLDDCGD